MQYIYIAIYIYVYIIIHKHCIELGSWVYSRMFSPPGCAASSSEENFAERDDVREFFAMSEDDHKR